MTGPRRVSIQDNRDSTIEAVFGRFSEVFKEFKESTEYDDMEEVTIVFDSNMLELNDTTNIELIINEINRISRRIYMYGVLFESQQMVVQQVEDDFSMWSAEHYTVIDNETITVEQKNGTSIEKKVTRTENAKEKLIMYTCKDEYAKFKDILKTEKYKLGLLKRTVGALDSYSYKLHSILSYRQLSINK